MQFFTTALALLATTASAVPTYRDIMSRQNTIDPSLVPSYGIQRGVNPESGSCDGANGVKIPCSCPPLRQDFLNKLNQNVAAGNVLGNEITFNTDPNVQDSQTNIDRATAMLITLQNFNGTAGVGCPAASAPNFLSQQQTGQVAA